MANYTREDSITKNLTADLAENNTFNSKISVEEERKDSEDKYSWEELVDKWHAQRFELTKNQKKLNEELLSTLYGLEDYTEVHNFHTDIKYDRPGTLNLEKFLDNNKDDKDLKVVLDLKRGKSGKTILHHVADFNISAVYALLEAGADPNIKDKEGKVPLHYATNGRYENVIMTLLNKEAVVNIQDNEGNTPLHNSAECGDANAVELFMNKDPDINLKNKKGNTPLHLALDSQDTDVSKSILNKGRDIDFSIVNNKGYTSLCLAAALSDTEVLELILEKGADIKYRNSVDNTALHYAACNIYTGNRLTYDRDYTENIAYKNIGVLIKEGIEVNAKNNYDQTPLFFATEANNINVIERLLEKGADIKVQDKNGYTALHYAIKIKELETLKKLLPCKVNSDGVATEEVDIEKAKEILSNIRDKEGNTLLHHATRYGCSSGMLSFLVENGVDINAKNKNGVAPIHIAAKYGHTHLIDFFIKNKADINVQCGNFTKSEIDITEKNFINVQDGSGDASSVIDVKNDTEYKDASPTLIAVENSHENAADKLLSKGAKSNIKDYRGWTPIQIAIRTACDKSCKEEEREKAYRIVEKLAVFSNIEVFKSKSSVSQITTKIKELLKGVTEDKESSLVQAVNNDERIRRILDNAIRSRESDKLPSAPVDQYAPSAPPLDDDFYDKIGSYVKDIPDLKLYPDLSKELEENTIDNLNEEQSINDSLNKQSVSEECSKYIKEFRKIAESAASQGKLENLAIRDTTFYLKYSPDSVVNVAKIVEGAKSLGLYQGSIECGGNIIKIGESAVEIETNNGIRNYTNLSDNGDVILTFQTSLGELEVRLIENKDRITVEVSDNDRKILDQLKDKKEIGKNCLLGGYLVCDAIEQGYFGKSEKLQSSETISFLSQDMKEETKMESISSTSVKGVEKEKSWQSRMKAEKTNGSCSRGI